MQVTFTFLLTVLGAVGVHSLPPLPPETRFSSSVSVSENFAVLTRINSIKQSPSFARQYTAEEHEQLTLSRKRRFREIERKYLNPAQYIWQRARPTPENLVRIAVDLAKPRSLGHAVFPQEVRGTYLEQLNSTEFKLRKAMETLRESYLSDRNRLLRVYGALIRKQEVLGTSLSDFENEEKARKARRDQLVYEISMKESQIEKLESELGLTYVCPISGVSYDECTEPSHQHHKVAYDASREGLKKRIAELRSEVIRLTGSTSSETEWLGHISANVRQELLNEQRKLEQEFLRYEEGRSQLKSIQGLYSGLSLQLKEVIERPQKIVGEWWEQSREFDEIEFEGSASKNSDSRNREIHRNPFGSPAVPSRNLFN